MVNEVKRAKFYVGPKIFSFYSDYEVFKSVETPVPSTHSHLYRFVFGPFKTKRGAEWFKDNPNVQHVDDAEIFAKEEFLKKKEKKQKIRKWIEG
jgi:hypothetical protein